MKLVRVVEEGAQPEGGVGVSSDVDIVVDSPDSDLGVIVDSELGH